MHYISTIICWSAKSNLTGQNDKRKIIIYKMHWLPQKGLASLLYFLQCWKMVSYCPVNWRNQREILWKWSVTLLKLWKLYPLHVISRTLCNRSIGFLGFGLDELGTCESLLPVHRKIPIEWYYFTNLSIQVGTIKINLSTVFMNHVTNISIKFKTKQLQQLLELKKQHQHAHLHNFTWFLLQRLH